MASVERIADLSAGQHQSLLRTELPRDRPARFHRVARLYRVMEYLSFGPMLERCRFHAIPAVTHARRAVVFGDGDGRFLARLLAGAPQLHADAIDASSAMLHLLRNRVAAQGDLQRLSTICTDARIFTPDSRGYDLVATHFFLDCLAETEADRLISRVRPHLHPGTRWLVSEFSVPDSGSIQRGLAQGIISGLYAAFRLLTGLAVDRIPPWPALLSHHGFTRKATHSWLGGLLVAEVWELSEQPRPSLCPPTEK